jgi:hypothetical protein
MIHPERFTGTQQKNFAAISACHAACTHMTNPNQEVAQTTRRVNLRDRLEKSDLPLLPLPLSLA